MGVYKGGSMTPQQCKNVFDRIYKQFSKEIWIHPGDCGKDDRAYSLVAHREIVLPNECFSNPSEWDILVFLHEIGHVKTNTSDMRVFAKEYYATKWAAAAAQQIGLKIKPLWKKTFQEYIWNKRQNCINHKGKNVPSKEALLINW